MKKIGIIGLGLIGGSIYRDLKALNCDVIAVSNSQTGEGIYKNYDALKDREVVFVCTPMNKTLAVLDELENILSPDTIVTDVCSLKEFVCEKQRSYNFIPSHPMAGTENKGFESSLEGLFRDKKWVVIETRDKGLETSKTILADIIEALGAKIVYMDAKAHDEAVALISHMPMVVAQALFLTAQDNPAALEVAASGFRDMTRLALSNEEMATDMVNMNAENIQTAILKLYQSIGKLMTNDYPELISKIKTERDKMF